MNAVNNKSFDTFGFIDRLERNVPRTLLNLPIWLLHTADKVPMYADGQLRHGKLDSPEDRARLVPFTEAAAALLIWQGTTGLGVALGRVPGTNITVSGIDLDHCYRDGKLDDRAQQIMTTSNSYAEKSPSGEGLHVLGFGDLGTTKVRVGTMGLEIYSGARYFTMTGDVINRGEPGSIAEGAQLARRLFDQPPGDAPRPEAITGLVHTGGRNDFLTREAGKLRRIGLDPPALSVALQTLNQHRCKPPLADHEVEQIARGILRYPAHSAQVEGGTTVQLLRGTELHPEPISWLWSGWLAHGKLHILAGAPGCGKTTIALAFAATVTAGDSWPDKTRANRGNVLIWSGEDDPNDTLLPRLLAMGADRTRIYFVGGVSTGEGQRRPFDPARDMDSLSDEARKIGDISLILVDPVVNAVAGDSHKNTETRRSLQPLVDLATRLGAAVLGISHYTKGTQGRDPVERVTGSIAFGALPRIVMGAAKAAREDGEIDRILVRAKSNIGLDGGGYAYRLLQAELSQYPGIVASSVVWGAPLDGAAHELLATAENAPDGEDRTALSEAEAFLRAELASGDTPSTELTKRAKEVGISERTLKRAKKSMHIRAHKDGTTGAWYCSLPPCFRNVADVGQTSPPQLLDLLGPPRRNEECINTPTPEAG